MSKRTKEDLSKVEKSEKDTEISRKADEQREENKNKEYKSKFLKSEESDEEGSDLDSENGEDNGEENGEENQDGSEHVPNFMNPGTGVLTGVGVVTPGYVAAGMPAPAIPAGTASAATLNPSGAPVGGVNVLQLHGATSGNNGPVVSPASVDPGTYSIVPQISEEEGEKLRGAVQSGDATPGLGNSGVVGASGAGSVTPSGRISGVTAQSPMVRRHSSQAQENIEAGTDQTGSDPSVGGNESGESLGEEHKKEKDISTEKSGDYRKSDKEHNVQEGDKSNIPVKQSSGQTVPFAQATGHTPSMEMMSGQGVGAGAPSNSGDVGPIGGNMGISGVNAGAPSAITGNVGTNVGGYNVGGQGTGEEGVGSVGSQEHVGAGGHGLHVGPNVGVHGQGSNVGANIGNVGRDVAKSDAASVPGATVSGVGNITSEKANLDKSSAGEGSNLGDSMGVGMPGMSTSGVGGFHGHDDKQDDKSKDGDNKDDGKSELTGVFKHLTQEHKRVSEHLNRLKSATDSNKKRELFAKVRKELLAHEQGEKREVYPVLLENSTTSSIVDEHEQDAKKLEECLNGMQDVDGSDWSSKLDELISLVEKHVEKEEKDYFPKAQKVFGDRAVEMQSKFERAKQNAMNSL